MDFTTTATKNGDFIVNETLTRLLRDSVESFESYRVLTNRKNES